MGHTAKLTMGMAIQTRRSGLVLLATIVLVLGACSASDKPEDSSKPTAAPAGPTYSTTSFIIPLDVTVPEWLPQDVSADESNFLTWAPESLEDPAVRFLVPVNVYRPGDAQPTPPPEDYLGYLMAQSKNGAIFADTAETTVDGKPATLVTGTVKESLDGSLGCPAEGLEGGDCYGLQPDLALRIAVIDVGDRTLVAWLRHSGTADTEAAAEEFAAFEEMLATVSFRDEAPSTTDTTAPPASTAIDGEWKKSISEDELASSPLLYDRAEVNDQNWGKFTFSFGDGEFTFHQMNTKAKYSVSGSFAVEGDVVRLSLDNGEQFVMRYSITGGKLAFTRDKALGVSPTPYVLKPWTPA